MPTRLIGGMSIEEGAILSAAIIESLRSEIALARPLGEGAYAIKLTRSASRPRDLTKATDRSWGSRALLGQVTGTIRVLVENGRISSLGLSLDNYKPKYSGGLLYVKPQSDRVSRDGVSLNSTFSGTDQRLKITQPGCLAIG